LANIPSISTLYAESHAINYTSIRIKGDQIVNKALDAKVSREGQWIRKQSAAVQLEPVIVDAIAEIDDKCPTLGKDARLEKAKKDVIKRIRTKAIDMTKAKAETLILPGQLPLLLHEMEMDADWKSELFSNTNYFIKLKKHHKEFITVQINP